MPGTLWNILLVPHARIMFSPVPNPDLSVCGPSQMLVGFPGPPGQSCGGPQTTFTCHIPVRATRWDFSPTVCLPAHPAPKASCLGSVWPATTPRWWRGPLRRSPEKSCGARVGSFPSEAQVAKKELCQCQEGLVCARGATLNCGICPGGVSMQKQWCLGGLKSSKPWRWVADVNISVMTAWRKKKVLPCTFGFVCFLKGWWGWMLIFFFFSVLYGLWNTPGRAVPGNLFLHWKLSSPPSMNEFSWVMLCHHLPVWVRISSSCC